IGQRRQLKLTKMVNVPANSEITLNFPLDQQTFRGDPRVGVYIEIEHPYDINLSNNRGSQVHDGGFTTESGRNFSVQIPIFNNFPRSREIRLELMPTDLTVSVNPVTRMFAPFEEFVATLNIQISNSLSGSPGSYISREVTVIGLAEGDELIGGITRLIRIDN
ncbi:MAG: hypothetical protein AAGG51_10260, partial [Cyanobacteria bacterium P01_G01_bin.54]